MGTDSMSSYMSPGNTVVPMLFVFEQLSLGCAESKLHAIVSVW